MNEQIWQAITGIFIAVVASFCAYYMVQKYGPIIRAKTAAWLEINRPKIRDKVRDWLHENNLQNTKLLDVYLKIDEVAGNAEKVLFQVYAETKETGKVKITEEELTIEEFEQINNAAKTKKIIKQIGQEKISIMSQVM